MRKQHYLISTYNSIKARCTDPKAPGYKNYGGRGIVMDGAWYYDRNKFIMYMLTNLGDRPLGYTLDRIDNDKGYLPGNLRWANRQTQAENRRKQYGGRPVIRVVHNGEKMSQAECARKIGKTREYIRQVANGKLSNKHNLIFEY